MNPSEVHRHAVALGLSLERDGDRLLVFGSDHDVLPPDFAEILKAHKPQLLDWLSHQRCRGWQSVPPADLTLSRIMPRPTPHDRERMIAYLLRQGCDRPGPLNAWLVRRENSYYEGGGKKWDCGLICYSAARDAACWQLNRNERDLWELLASFEGSRAEG